MDLLAIAGTVLGIVGIAGGAFAYFSKSRGEAIITYQAREIELRDGTVARLEKELAAVSAERDSLKEQIPILQALAQGSPQLKALAGEMKNLVREVKNLIGKREK